MIQANRANTYSKIQTTICKLNTCPSAPTASTYAYFGRGLHAASYYSLLNPISAPVSWVVSTCLGLGAARDGYVPAAAACATVVSSPCNPAHTCKSSVVQYIQ